VSFIDEMFDESEVLSDEDKAALAAEERGETYEAEPETPPELVEEKRELSRQLAEERERFARLDERRIAREEAEAPSRQQGPPEPPSQLGERPDPYYDPIGADLWDVKREAEVLRLQFHEQQAERQRQEFSNWVDDDAQRFRSQHPDYDDATAHAYKFRVEYWKGLGLPEGNARTIVDQEAVATAMLARQNGKSAAETFYALSRKVGYQPNGTQQSAARGAPSRQRQATTRGKPQTRTAVDIDAMSEAQLESALRRNPRGVAGITRALERRELLGR
jgi:hypothetical protein